MIRAALFALLVSCGAPQRAAFISCAENAAVADLKPTVISILTSGVSNWKSQLGALVAAFGKDAVDCTVQAFLANVGGPDPAAFARAKEWLAS